MEDKKQLFHLRFIRIANAIIVTFLVFLFLADQVLYKPYVNLYHFRLRSFASLRGRPLAGKKSLDFFAEFAILFVAFKPR